MDRETIDHAVLMDQRFKVIFVNIWRLNPGQTWYSSGSTEEDPWPDAWCSICREVIS